MEPSGMLRRTFSLPPGETRDLRVSTLVLLFWTLGGGDQRPDRVYVSPAGLGADPGTSTCAH